MPFLSLKYDGRVIECKNYFLFIFEPFKLISAEQGTKKEKKKHWTWIRAVQCKERCCPLVAENVKHTLNSEQTLEAELQ